MSKYNFEPPFEVNGHTVMKNKYNFEPPFEVNGHTVMKK